MADYPDQGTPMDASDHPANTVPDATDHHDGSVFNVPSRDYSKQPASLGEIVSNTAKMVAEPYAQTISKAYNRWAK